MSVVRNRMLAVALAGGVAAMAIGGLSPVHARTAEPPVLARMVPPGAPLSFADIFEKVSPAVVSISAEVGKEPARRAVADGGEQDDEGAGGGVSIGSGFLVSADGYVVTNNHVVKGAKAITVKLSDDTELKADLVGHDPGTDLAVLKVQGVRKDYPFVQFEHEAKPRVGDWVVAIGNPYNLGGTATAGIISTSRREVGERYVDYLQIDAPINKGNSGGPTFDTYGRVVGINTAIFSPTEGSAGIAFAIPADVAEAVVKELIATGKITRGYLGASLQDVTPEIGSSLGLPPRKGALVSDIEASSPAAKGGVQTGDVIESINGEAVTSAVSALRRVAGSKVDEMLKLKVYRGGKAMDIEVKAGARPASLDQDQQSDT